MLAGKGNDSRERLLINEVGAYEKSVDFAKLMSFLPVERKFSASHTKFMQISITNKIVKIFGRNENSFCLPVI